jgi:hypothetical protein
VRFHGCNCWPPYVDRVTYARNLICANLAGRNVTQPQVTKEQIERVEVSLCGLVSARLERYGLAAQLHPVARGIAETLCGQMQVPAAQRGISRLAGGAIVMVDGVLLGKFGF